MGMPVYAIGTTSAVSSLEALGLPWPQATAVDYALYVETGSGEVIQQGWLMCEWRFTALTQAQLATLLGYVGNCYIITLLYTGLYAKYSALMVQPRRRTPRADATFDVVVEFRKMVAV